MTVPNQLYAWKEGKLHPIQKMDAEQYYRWLGLTVSPFLRPFTDKVTDCTEYWGHPQKRLNRLYARWGGFGPLDTKRTAPRFTGSGTQEKVVSDRNTV